MDEDNLKISKSKGLYIWRELHTTSRTGSRSLYRGNNSEFFIMVTATTQQLHVGRWSCSFMFGRKIINLYLEFELCNLLLFGGLWYVGGELSIIATLQIGLSLWVSLLKNSKCLKNIYIAWVNASASILKLFNFVLFANMEKFLENFVIIIFRLKSHHFRGTCQKQLGPYGEWDSPSPVLAFGPLDHMRFESDLITFNRKKLFVSIIFTPNPYYSRTDM